jgi:predicted nucleic acid-binding protein
MGATTEVFIDTAGWIALVSPRDDFHSQAKEAYGQLKKALRVTTDVILIEIGDTLRKPPLRPLAITLIEEIRLAERLGLAEVVHVDRELLEQGFALFQSRPDKEWSLTDCISFAVMQKRGIWQALTTDHHFEQAGFERLLKP